jgi:hypothetical protein
MYTKSHTVKVFEHGNDAIRVFQFPQKKPNNNLMKTLKSEHQAVRPRPSQTSKKSLLRPHCLTQASEPMQDSKDTLIILNRESCSERIWRVFEFPSKKSNELWNVRSQDQPYYNVSIAIETLSAEISYHYCQAF